MKRYLVALSACLVLLLAVLLILPHQPAQAAEMLKNPPTPIPPERIELPRIDLPRIPLVTPEPTRNIDRPEINLPRMPLVTPEPTRNIDRPEINLPRMPLVTPEPTFRIPDLRIPLPDRPLPDLPDIPVEKPSTGSGHYFTSEGPLFLSFRHDLTEKLLMFTPMDLSLEGTWYYPLIGSSQQVVGEAKVVTKNGLTTVTCLLVSGVKLAPEDEFYTFFPDIRDISTLRPSKLQDVKLKFGVPYQVASWLGSDTSVLLYINCQVSYKTSLGGLTDFSFEDPAYLERMYALLPLMD